MSCKLSYAAD